jgi:hypothetical protein
LGNAQSRNGNAGNCLSGHSVARPPVGYFRFRRSFRLLPGLRLNLGKRSASLSVGVRGAHVTFGGPQGTRTTISAPGTGLSYTEVSKPAHAPPDASAAPVEQPSASRGWLWLVLLIVFAAWLIFGASGCATTLQAGADQVRVATAAQKEQLCQPIKIISVEQRVGPNKPGNAMSKALNAVAAAGGNGIYVISTSTDWAEGASVTAEALRCKW